MPQERSRRRAAVLAHFDPDGEIAPHVRRFIEELRAVVPRTVIVSTSDLTVESRSWISSRAELITRPNTGHDFASYRAGLEWIQGDVDQLILANDSVVFPLTPFGALLDELMDRKNDFGGITEGFGFAPHLQTYFTVYSGVVLRSTRWAQFWAGVEPGLSRGEVVLQYEVGLSRALQESGFTSSSWLRPTALDRWRGAARADQRQLAAALAHRNVRGSVGWVRRLARHARTPEWNVSAALADLALTHPHRLPAVKLSVLRQDPYGLGTPELLSALEAQHPTAFAGVRQYLERTDRHYGDSWAETRQRPRSLLRYRSR